MFTSAWSSDVCSSDLSPSSGDVTKSGSSYPDISTTYTAPDNDSTMKLQVRVSNELEIGVTSHFNVYVTDDIETQNTVDTNPVIENISAERLDNGDLKWTMNVSNDDGFSGLKVKWEYMFGDNRTFTNKSNTATQGDSNRGVMQATMSGYQDSDDGMLLVTVCEDGDSEGIKVNKLTGKMGVRASTVGEIIFENCHVPASNRMGDENVGFRQTMSVLNSSRISIGAQCVGIAQSALEASISYAKTREAFGGVIGDLQAIQWMLVDSEIEIRACRWLVWEAAWQFDNGDDFRQAASVAKIHSAETLGNVVDRAIQVHGGMGVTEWLPLERWYREARIRKIGEGPTEVQKMVIARELLNPGGVHA
mgnify:CR=1 FL=1